MANEYRLRWKPNATYILLIHVGGLRLQILAFFDTNMLVSPQRENSDGPNASSFVSQWNIGIRIMYQKFDGDSCIIN